MVSASTNEISSLHVFSTRASSGGNSFQAATAIGTSSRIALPTFHAASPKLAPPLGEKLGSTTVRITTARSSTSDSVTISRPCSAAISPRSINRRSRTIVLATEMMQPTATPWITGQPSNAPTATPIPTHSKIPSGAPASATHFTFRSSGTENSMPTENISRITPISAITLEITHIVHAQPGRKRAQQQSGQHITKQNRLPQPPGKQSANQRRGKNHRNVSKNIGVFDQAAYSSPAKCGRKV